MIHEQVKQNEGSQKRLLMVDDNKAFRWELTPFLAAIEGLQLVGEAAGFADAERLVEKLRPDIVLMDIQLGDGNGLQLARLIRNRHPEIAVVVLTSYDIDEYRKLAENYGAAGYVTKTRLYNELPAVLKRVIHSKVRNSSEVGEFRCQTLAFWLPLTTAREVAEFLRQILHVDSNRWQTPHWQLIRALLVIVCLQVAVRVYWTVGVLIGNLAIAWTRPMT